MITRVKKNTRELRNFTKPSHVECAVGNVIVTNNCFSSKDHAASLKSKLSPEYELYNYLAKREKDSRLYLFGGL